MHGEPVTNHQELMSNFFAQPDALALGKKYDQLRAEGVPESLKEHKLFPGDRPSLSMLFQGQLTAYSCGILLALYEHRVAVEGFLYDANGFDPWGVALGKDLGVDIRHVLASVRKGGKLSFNMPEHFSEANREIMKYFLDTM